MKIIIETVKNKRYYGNPNLDLFMEFEIIV